MRLAARGLVSGVISRLEEEAAAERESHALAVLLSPIFGAATNVDVIGKADFVYAKGSSPLAFALHGASMLLRLSEAWDWFVFLDAANYPLVTQDSTGRYAISIMSEKDNLSIYSLNNYKPPRKNATLCGDKRDELAAALEASKCFFPWANLPFIFHFLPISSLPWPFNLPLPFPNLPPFPDPTSLLSLCPSRRSASGTRGLGFLAALRRRIEMISHSQSP